MCCKQKPQGPFGHSARTPPLPFSFCAVVDAAVWAAATAAAIVASPTVADAVAAAADAVAVAAAAVASALAAAAVDGVVLGRGVSVRTVISAGAAIALTKVEGAAEHWWSYRRSSRS